MHRFMILSAFIVGATLITPAAMSATDNQDKRYYDKAGREYHTWNSQEDRAYRVYLGEQHQKYRHFQKETPAQQQEYFKWHQEHPDNVLFKRDME